MNRKGCENRFPLRSNKLPFCAPAARPCDGFESLDSHEEVHNRPLRKSFSPIAANLFFVDYLRLCFRFGGFPGYEGIDRGIPAEIATLSEGLLEF
jgi:hypothetical protein